MVVNRTNLFSESRTVISSLINSNITDPKTSETNSRRRWLYREFPDTTSQDFAGYPIVVIKSPDPSDDVQDLCGGLSDTEVDFDIEVYVEFNDKNARVDEISDQIYGLFRSLSAQCTLKKNNLYEPDITSGPYTTIEEDNKLLSNRNFSLTLNTTIMG